MNSLFATKGVLAETMQEAVIALRNSHHTAIVLASVHDPFAPPDCPHLLRQEAMGELAERLFGKYTFYEYNFVTASQSSLPRYCRSLRERPACVFAYGLETLASHDPSRYHAALQALNNHREDIRETQTALVLWLSPDEMREVLRLAPDFADWRTATIAFEVGLGQDVPKTAIGSLPLAAANELRRQAQRFEQALQNPHIPPPLAIEFYEQLAQVYDQLGQIAQKREVQDAAKRLLAHLDNMKQVERIYLDYLIECFDGVEPRGISQTVRSVRLPLEEVYVSLTAERESMQERLLITLPPLPLVVAPHGAGKTAILRNALTSNFDHSPLSLPHEPRSEPVDLPRVVRESPRAVLLGDPGAGKTTLLRFLAVRFAKTMQNGEVQVLDADKAEYGDTRLPILLRVAEYANALHRNNLFSLRDFLPHAFDNAPVPQQALTDLFEDALQNGRALVLLDGLDEVADAGQRSNIARRIDGFVSGMGNGNRILVTSRIAGYQEAQLGSVFQQYTLRDMERDQIERFLNRWSVACERFHHISAGDAYITILAQKQSGALLAAIDGNPGVKRLAANPLLLTILALIHRNGGRLPERRVELYRIATETLLRDWRLAQAGAEARVVEEYEAEELLGPLAYWMHEHKPAGLIPEEDVRRKLREWHGSAHNLPAAHPDVKAGVDDFLRRVREQTGLFVERAPCMYGFMHLTFEEYFAARHIVADYTQAADRIRRFRRQARWEEPIRLVIAGERPRNAANLIRAALWHKDGVNVNTSYVPSEYEDILRRDLLLTARCLGDCATIEPTLAREVADELTTICLNHEHKGRYYPLRERVYETLPALANSEVGKEIQQRLLNALDDSHSRVRVRAIRALGRLEQSSETVIATLCDHLKDVDPDVWMNSALVLAQLGHASNEVLPTLLIAFSDSDYSIRDQAAYTLGQLGRTSEAATSTLLNAIKSNDNAVRMNAAKALGYSKQRSEAVISGLLEIIHDGDWEVRRSAAAALGQIGQTSDEVVSALLKALWDWSQFVRMEAANALGKLGQVSENVVNGLLTALKTNNPYIRMSAATALGQLKCTSVEVIAALLESLDDPDEFVRQDAAAALGQLGYTSSEIVSALKRLLKDEHSNVRASAAGALGRLGDTSEAIIDALLMALKDENYLVSEPASYILGELGQVSEATLSALLTALETAYPIVWDAAWESLWVLVSKRDARSAATYE